MLIKNGRRQDIDIMKGAGILIMIMGHMGFTEPFSHYIHAFNMPLFFILSGYLFELENYKTFGSFFVRKVRTLIIPYLFFGMVNFFVAYLTLESFDSYQGIFHLLWINNTGLPISGALWFLTSLFWAEIFFYFLVKYIRPNILVCVGGIIGILGTLISIRLPYSMNSAVVAVGFLTVGRHIRRTNCLQKMSSIKIWGVAFAFFLNAMMIFLNETVNMRKNQYSNLIFFWFNAIVACVLFWIMVNKIQNMECKWIYYIEQPFLYLGRNSMVFICFNETIIYFMKLFGLELEIENFLLKIVIKFGMLGFILLILAIIHEIMARTPMRLFLGRKR